MFPYSVGAAFLYTGLAAPTEYFGKCTTMPAHVCHPAALEIAPS